MKIELCPFCGYKLPSELQYGVIQCNHCSQFTNSNLFNLILSASWYFRTTNCEKKQLQSKFKLDVEYLDLIYMFVGEMEYTHNEFYHALKKFSAIVERN